MPGSKQSFLFGRGRVDNYLISVAVAGNVYPRSNGLSEFRSSILPPSLRNMMSRHKVASEGNRGYEIRICYLISEDPNKLPFPAL